MQKKVALGDIVDNPFQARKDFDQASVRSLANEIKVEGFWNTTLQARKSKKNGKVELVFGHRRVDRKAYSALLRLVRIVGPDAKLAQVQAVGAGLRRIAY